MFIYLYMELASKYFNVFALFEDGKMYQMSKGDQLCIIICTLAQTHAYVKKVGV